MGDFFKDIESMPDPHGAKVGYILEANVTLKKYQSANDINNL